MRIGMLTQWYDPEPGPAALPGVLARGLVQRGHTVNVVTGFPNYPTGQVAAGYTVSARQDEMLDGVGVRRVALYPSHDTSFARRLLNYGSFGASAAASGMSFVRGADALWVNYSPVTVALPMWVAQLRHRVPLVVHVGDLWPDTMTAGGFALPGALGTVTESVLDRWTEAMYASAEVVTYISPGVRDILRERGVPESKLEYAPMWAEESTFAPATTAVRAEGEAWRRDLGVAHDEILLLYAGALGHAQGLETLVEAAVGATRETRSRTDLRSRGVRVVVAGSGTAEPELRELAARLENEASTSEDATCGVSRPVVSFIGRVDQSRMPVLMAGADACYVGLRRDPLSAVTMPSKTQATMAAGRAIVVAADGDVQQVVRQAGAGYGTDSGDVDGLTRILVQLCESGRAALESAGMAGRRYYEAEFSVRRAVDRAEQALARAASAPQHR